MLTAQTEKNDSKNYLNKANPSELLGYAILTQTGEIYTF
jgi:hypothetical protein